MKRSFFLFLLLALPALAQTITIGVMPSELNLYKGESWVTFKLFNTYGDVDVYYIFIDTENVSCIENCKILVPKGTNIENPVRADVKLNVKNSGYIYITAKPANETEESGQVNIVQRVGVKVNCLNCAETAKTGSSTTSSHVETPKNVGENYEEYNKTQTNITKDIQKNEEKNITSETSEELVNNTTDVMNITNEGGSKSRNYLPIVVFLVILLLVIFFVVYHK